jgi:hypothetical protein
VLTHLTGLLTQTGRHHMAAGNLQPSHPRGASQPSRITDLDPGVFHRRRAHLVEGLESQKRATSCCLRRRHLCALIQHPCGVHDVCVTLCSEFAELIQEPGHTEAPTQIARRFWAVTIGNSRSGRKPSGRQAFLVLPAGPTGVILFPFSHPPFPSLFPSLSNLTRHSPLRQDTFAPESRPNWPVVLQSPTSCVVHPIISTSRLEFRHPRHFRSSTSPSSLLRHLFRKTKL